MEEQADEWHQQFREKEHSQPDARLLELELRDAVNRAIASLPEKQRMAVVLRRHEKMSYEDIAAILGISVSAVKSQLFRARTTLREMLGKFLGASSAPAEND